MELENAFGAAIDLADGGRLFEEVFLSVWRGEADNDGYNVLAQTAGLGAAAIGILRAFHEAGVRVPADIALVSFDGSLDAEYSWPALTTVSQPIEAMAEAAVRSLVGANRGEELQHHILPTELIIRQSCGCP